MTKVILELEDRAVQLAVEKARHARLTLSEWIGRRIVGQHCAQVSGGKRDDMGYPVGWFERTTGSLAEVEDFHEPSDPPPTAIVPLDL